MTRTLTRPALRRAQIPLWVLGATILGCASSSGPSEADRARLEQIQSGWSQLAVGQPIDQVDALIGVPAKRTEESLEIRALRAHLGQMKDGVERNEIVINGYRMTTRADVEEYLARHDAKRERVRLDKFVRLQFDEDGRLQKWRWRVDVQGAPNGAVPPAGAPGSSPAD